MISLSNMFIPYVFKCMEFTIDIDFSYISRNLDDH